MCPEPLRCCSAIESFRVISELKRWQVLYTNARAHPRSETFGMSRGRSLCRGARAWRCCVATRARLRLHCDQTLYRPNCLRTGSSMQARCLREESATGGGHWHCHGLMSAAMHLVCPALRQVVCLNTLPVSASVRLQSLPIGAHTASSRQLATSLNRGGRHGHHGQADHGYI